MKKILFSIACIFLVFSVKAQFTESFDASSSAPAGWTVINGGGTTPWRFGAPGLISTHSGARCAILASDTQAHNDYLITPQIPVAANVNDRVSFWVRLGAVAANQRLDVRLSSTNTDQASFSTLLQQVNVGSSGWGKVTVNLMAYRGQSIYLAFHVNILPAASICLDDVVNDGLPPCNFTAPIITSVSAPSDCNAGNVTISLSGLPATGTWTLYRAGTSSASFTGTGTTASVILSTAGSSAGYHFYYKDANLCQSPSSETVYLRAIHDIDINAPMTGTYADANSNGVFDAGDAINYQIQVHNSGTCVLNTTSVNGNTTPYNPNLIFSGNPYYTIPTLEGNTTISVGATYTITQADIDNGQVENTTLVNAHWSDNAGGSSTGYFPSCVTVLSNLNAQSFAFEMFQFSPNPVKDFLTFSNKLPFDTITVSTALGQNVISKRVNSIEETLDLSSFERGIYFVSLSSNGARKTIKIIKE